MNWDFLIKDKTSICVSTDTRNLPVGCIFFALKGENFNGNIFAFQALEMGAEYVVVDEDIPSTCSQKRCFDKQIIRVENTLLALQDLARTWRRQWGKTIIGITGTNGKTTTKELTAAVLSEKYSVHYTQGNLNNQVGVPLTLLQLTNQHDLAIVEMGASHPGDIKELVDIAEPDMGLVTNVGKAHLLGFGSFEGVMKTKAELYDYLRQHNGTCFRNLDNPYLEQMAAGLKTIGYHTGTMPEGMHLIGEYNSENVSAALCVGEYFGVSKADGLKAVRAYIPKNNRSQLLKTKKNNIVVDAYNANPTSMRAAILSFLKTYPNDSSSVFILGDMLELGEQSHLEHQNIVNLLAEQKVHNVLLVGKEFMKTTASYHTFENTDQLRDYLQNHKIENANILLKGSRGVRMEKVIDIL